MGVRTLVLAFSVMSCVPAIAGESADSSSSTLTITEIQKSTSYLDRRAAEWVGKTNWSFVQGGRCVMSCHTTVPFMIVRPELPESTSNALDTVRVHVETRVNGWASTKPLYSWVPEASKGTEAVANALALVSADAPSGALSATAQKALEVMWSEQQANGGFKWWDSFSLAPWENKQAPTWGAALAELTVGMAPDTYLSSMNDTEKTKLAKLDDFVRARAASPTEPLHNRAMIVLASSRRATLLGPVKNTILDQIVAKQSPDGSFSAGSLGFPVAGKDDPDAPQGPHAPHAYATAFYTYVLIASGRTDAANKGRAWLVPRQRSDGAWEAKSLNRPEEPFNNSLMTDAATAYALMALR